MLVQFKLVKTADTAHRGEHRQLQVDGVEFLPAHRLEARIVESGSTGHPRHNLAQRHILAKMTYATTQLSMPMERHKGSTLHIQPRVVGMQRHRTRDRLSVERIADACCGNLFQLFFLLCGQHKACCIFSNYGKGVIAHHPATVVIIHIARVPVHQVLHFVTLVEHQQQGGNGQFATCTRGEIPDTALGILPYGRNQLAHVAALNSLSRQGIHLASIVV